MARPHPAGALSLAAVALAAAMVWFAIDLVDEAEHAGRRALRDAAAPTTAPPPAAPHATARTRPEPDAPAAGDSAQVGAPRDPAAGVRAPGPAAGGPVGAHPPADVLAALASVATAPDDLLGIAAPGPHPGPIPARPPAGLVVALTQAALPPDELVGIATPPYPRQATRAKGGGVHPPAGVVAALASVAVSVDELLAVSAPAPRPAAPRPVQARPTIPAAEAREAMPTAAPAPAPPAVAARRYVTGQGGAPDPVESLVGPRPRAATGAFRPAAWPTVDGGPSGIPLVRPRADGVGAAAGEGDARPAGRDGARGGIPSVLAITGDDELTAIVGHGDLGRR